VVARRAAARAGWRGYVSATVNNTGILTLGYVAAGTADLGDGRAAAGTTDLGDGRVTAGTADLGDGRAVSPGWGLTRPLP
jgi:hypothetical protein